MGTLISVFLAATLQGTGDIRTGHDLLAACTHRDTRVCDAFIAQEMQTNPEYGCLPATYDRVRLRLGFIDLAKSGPRELLGKPAALALFSTIGPICSAD